MRDLVTLSEPDLDLVSALQIAPRAPWSLVGDVLQVDPATAARRWDRLREAGAAWMTCYPGLHEHGPVCVAFIEVNCAPGRALEVATQASKLPSIATIEHVTGDRDLYLTAFLDNLHGLSEFLLTDLLALPGAYATRAQVATQVYVQGSNWKLGGLDPAQRDRLQQSLPTQQNRPITSMKSADWQLVRSLAQDPRAAYTDLATEVGFSVSTVRRRVESLLGAGLIGIRCEVSRELAGVPTSATVWANVPPAELPEAAKQIASLPETRLCAGITGGPANLLFSVWLRTPGELQQIETTLGTLFPRLSVVDRALALRHVKRVGRLLDDGDRAGELVPLRIWQR